MKTTERPLTPTTKDVLKIVAESMSTNARDWSVDPMDAWLYGIFVGWGEAIDEVGDRHNWTSDGKRRLERLRKAIRETVWYAQENGGEP